MKMGTVTTTIEVGDPRGRNFRETELEVDAGSTYTALPREMLESLGVPVNRTERSRLDYGTEQPVAVGWTQIRVAGKQIATPVTFAEEGDPSLLGVVTLEDAALGEDPLNNELITVTIKRYWSE